MLCAKASRRPLIHGRLSHYNASENKPKMTLPRIQKMYKNNTPISVITAHDYISGLMADRAGVDIVLVGDSLSMVAMGYANTNEIDLDEMIYHTKAVSRGVKSAFLIADLPFGSYEVSPEQAHTSALKMMKYGLAEAVKLEGGVDKAPTIKKLTSSGIPVCGHIGLTPQRASSFGGFKIQGKTVKSAASILEDALAVQEAGASMLVLEAVPDRIGDILAQQIKIPIIGIGAGPATGGQVLVQLDMLGGFDTFAPKFVKKYANYLETNVNAIKAYHEEVKSRSFPAKEHCYTVSDEEYEKFKAFVAEKNKSL